jgi:CubicO group peptidase (beta-lactamase class C family)
MTGDTIFRLASMTKPIIAVGAMILAEECRIRLDDPVDEWLPEQKDRRVLRTIDGPLDDTVPASRQSGGGGLVSTVDDLLAFGRMMLDGGALGRERILSRPTVELMTIDHITPEQKAASPFFAGSGTITAGAWVWGCSPHTVTSRAFRGASAGTVRSGVPGGSTRRKDRGHIPDPASSRRAGHSAVPSRLLDRRLSTDRRLTRTASISRSVTACDRRCIRREHARRDRRPRTPVRERR